MQTIATIHNQILDFTRHHPASCFHTIDMPYRLSSPAAHDPLNCRVWTDGTGVVVGFGVVQLPFSTLDWAVLPGRESLYPEIVAWGVARLEEIARQRDKQFGYLLDSRDDSDSVALQHGFVLDDWYIRNLAMELDQVPIAEMPLEIQIRPLKGMEEVNAYVDLHRAAFQTRNMSIDWRAKTLMHPLYQPQLDLVAESADGKLAAFCIGWLAQIDASTVGQIEPLGVLPMFQGKGLGRAILSESLQRFKHLGAKQLLIDAESTNRASQSLYESVGFIERSRTYKYFRIF